MKEFNQRNRWRHKIEELQLAFYRITSDHHTNLVKILNSLVLLVALFGIFSFVLNEIKVPSSLNRDLDSIMVGSAKIAKTQQASNSSFLDFSIQQNIPIYNIPNSDFKKDLESIKKLIQQYKSNIVFFVSSSLFILLIMFIMEENNLFRLITFTLSFLSLVLPLLILFNASVLIWIIYVLFLLVFLYIALLVLCEIGDRFLKYMIVGISYFSTLLILIIKPSLFFPFFGKLIDETSKIDYPALTSLGVVYMILMLLMLFSLQKTARKNSILPT